MPIQFDDYHRTVVGYHGTRLETARKIVLRKTDFRWSRNEDDWLGHGVYFWEHAPKQALAWARQRYAKGAKIAVVGAMIRLGRCFDLLEPSNVEVLRGFGEDHDRAARDAGSSVRQNANARKFRDCSVFEYATAALDEAGVDVESVRAVFVPSGARDRVWTRSGLFRGAHIQLCVRHRKNILGAWLEADDGAE